LLYNSLLIYLLINVMGYTGKRILKRFNKVSLKAHSL